MKNNSLLLIAFLFFTGGLYACECIWTKSMKEMVADADIIFYGTVVSVDDRNDPYYKEYIKYNTFGNDFADKGGYEPAFKIIENFKGEINEQLVDGAFQYQRDWTNCDRFYKIGYSYTFFGNYDDKGKIRTSICLTGGIVKDLNFLEKIRELTRKK